MARALEERPEPVPGRGRFHAAQVLRARNAALSERHACTSATCATTPSATRWRATSGCAATTCCIPWAGTRSACRPKTPPSRTSAHPREWTMSNIAEMKRQHRRMGFSYDWDLRNRHLRARILPLEPVVLPEDVRARPGLSQEGAGELVPGVRHRAGERAGGGRLLLASRIDAGGAARTRAVVPARSPLTPTNCCATSTRSSKAAGRSACCRCSATGSGARKARRSISSSKATRRADSRVHHARRHDLRRDVRDPGAGASAGRAKLLDEAGRARRPSR